MDYALILKLHALFAVLTVVVYLVRGILFIRKSPALYSPAGRMFAHVVYGGVLLLGLTLAVLSHQWLETWLITKVLVFAAVVSLGLVAFRQTGSLPRSRRISLWGMGMVLMLMIFAIVAFHFATQRVAGMGA